VDSGVTINQIIQNNETQYEKAPDFSGAFLGIGLNKMV
jgi:hypothetical protein